MLDIENDAPPLADLLDSLPCEIELPAKWEDYFDKTGLLATGPEDKRRCPRFYLRAFAALETRQTFPALARPHQWHRVYTKDVSRGGLCFLHSEQLFPRERMRILMGPEGQQHAIAITRCTRIQDHCFEIGARFVQSLDPATDSPVQA